MYVCVFDMDDVNLFANSKNFPRTSQKFYFMLATNYLLECSSI